MKRIRTLYEIRRYVGDGYSLPLSSKLKPLKLAKKLVKRLGDDTFYYPLKVRI